MMKGKVQITLDSFSRARQGLIISTNFMLINVENCRKHKLPKNEDVFLKSLKQQCIHNQAEKRRGSDHHLV